MDIIEKLKKRWDGISYPFLIYSDSELYFNNILEQKTLDLSDVHSGDVVALIGDFDPQTIHTLLHLMEKNTILVPLTTDTRYQHEYFFKSALVDIVIERDTVKNIKHTQKHEQTNDNSDSQWEM